MIWGDVKVSTGDGTTYNLKSDESSGTGRGLLLKKNDGKVYTATIRGNLKDITILVTIKEPQGTAMTDTHFGNNSKLTDMTLLK